MGACESKKSASSGKTKEQDRDVEKVKNKEKVEP